MSDPFTLARLWSTMAARGDRPAIISVADGAARTLPYRHLVDTASRIAAGLRDAGLANGEAVGLWGPNSAEWIIASLAVVAAGGVIVPVDDLAANEEALAFLVDSGARWVFASGAHLATLAASPLAGSSLLRLDGDDGEGAGAPWRTLLSTSSLQPPTDADPARPLALFYTSGTTGAPKSFFLSERNIGANIDGLLASGTVSGDDRLLLPLPLHHAYPWIVGTLAVLAHGACIVLPQGVSGPQLIAALKAGEVTVLVGVPRLYAALASGIEGRATARGPLAAAVFRAGCRLARAAAQRFDWNLGRWLLSPVRRQIGPKLRLLVSGGAKLEAEIIWQLRALGWEVLSGYGLAETASIFTANLPHAKRIGSEGRPITADGRVRIAAADGNGGGEIELKGSSVFAGYRNNEAANAEAFTADGWFRTGDLGWLDDDGFLYVTGRAKEVLVLAGGKNVYPEELEKEYGEAPGIAELAVLEREGRLVALVRPDLAAIAAHGSLKPFDAIRVALTTTAQRLPSFKRLSGFALVAEPLPRTRLGKYRRFLLPQLYEAALAGRTAAPALTDAERAWLSVPPRQQLWELLKARYGSRPLALSTSPQLDLGFDSFEWMTLALEIEDKLGIRLLEEDIAAASTLRALIERAEMRHAGGGGERGGETTAVEEWLRPPSPPLAAFAAVVHALNTVVCRTFFSLRVEGLERLPASGPLLIAPNHVSDLDPPALAAALPRHLRRQVTWAAELTRLLGGRLGRLVGRALRIHPVDERRPQQALAVATEALRRGGIEVWFPESWRSPDGRLQRFLPGIGRLILDSGAPVVPTLILGSFEAWPRHRRWPRPGRVRVVFGEPIAAQTLRAAAGSDEPDAVAAALHDATLRLARAVGAEEVLPAA